ncbi:Sigma factor RpoE negative regulatory protein RseB precursor [Marinobacter nitratireducens]|uniref:Sigma factor RpoE negative regulatory protein RseB n=1 Tax=Marinobacter nitratireducens TaxID=1137280 RepID=A0A072N1I9_9GAMM|nr:MucB/RseB C-terminal domain-containing protein [Marinobacter nitratireducens]KEF31072.1 Sigma factor RpoE negative regulatory protein RseB precursor [Marinobacter nitratireducens]
MAIPGSYNVLNRLAIFLVFTALIVPVSVYGAGERSKSAADWLEQLGPALNMTSYRGVFVYARGDSVHSMRIAHRYRDDKVQERLVIQDGGSGEIVRKGTDVVCVLPRQGKVRLNQVIPSGPFAKAFSNQSVPLSQWYNVELVGEDRVAGYSAVIVALNAKDAFRYNHRLWLEKSTGLLVKSNVGGAGKVLEHFQFTSLEITDDIPDSEFEIQTQGRAIARSVSPKDEVAAPVNLDLDGWRPGWLPEGFLPAAAPRSGSGHAVAFSDGVAAFSIFVEPEGTVKMPSGVSRIGATTVYMRELGSGDSRYLITVVGEVPPKTAKQVAESVQVDSALALNVGRP